MFKKACGTSLEAAVDLGNKIALGQIESAIAAGVDTSSDVPIELKDRFSQKLVQLSKCRTMGQRLKVISSMSFGDILPNLPSVKEGPYRTDHG